MTSNHQQERAAQVKAPDRRRWQLLFALQQAGQPLSANELFNAVPEYQQAGGVRNDALEKLFERDRAALASEGFVIEIVRDEAAPDDRSQWRYALAMEASDTLHLDAEETLLIQLATRVWLDDGVMTDARRSYLKLLGVGEGGVARRASLPALQLVMHPSVRPLQEAAARGLAVRFDYVNQDAQPARRRHVVPLQLVQVEGRWLCHAWDLDRDAERNFVCSRIVSDVELAEDHQHSYNALIDVPAMLSELAAKQPVQLRVVSNSDAAVRLQHRAIESVRSPDGTQVTFTILEWDHGLLADELAGFGTQITVLSPVSLRDAVRLRLERAALAHGAVPSGSSGTA